MTASPESRRYELARDILIAILTHPHRSPGLTASHPISRGYALVAVDQADALLAVLEEVPPEPAETEEAVTPPEPVVEQPSPTPNPATSRIQSAAVSMLRKTAEWNGWSLEASMKLLRTHGALSFETVTKDAFNTIMRELKDHSRRREIEANLAIKETSPVEL